MENRKYNVAQPLLLSIILASGMLIGYRLDDSEVSLIQTHNNEQDLRPTHIDNVMRLIESNYLFDPDYNEMTNNVLYSLSQSLDPFSAYISPSEFNHVQDNLNASYIGMGIYSQNYKDSLVVVEIINKSPAEKAGLKTLEKLLKINGKDLTGLSNDQISKEFGNVKGKEIELIVSDRQFKKRIVNLKIDTVETQTVDREYYFGNSTLYLGISQFSNHTYREMLSKIEKYAKEKKLKNLIIDVRDNPGGYLQEVVKILDQLFNKSGLTLVETVYKDGRKDVIKTSGRNFYEIENIRVLINEFSASGSEVLAGALQDNDRALIIGNQSFGKGLVQDQYDLFNGGALRLTVANYYLPSGRSIQKRINFPKSMKSDLFYSEQDTFYSRLLNRPVFSGRGIEPDITINDTTFIKAQFLVENGGANIFKMLTDFIFRNPYLLKMPANEIKSADIFKKDSVINVFLEKHDFIDKKVLSEILRSKIGYLLYGRKLETEILLKNDPFVREALKPNTLKFTSGKRK
ncbi:MAG: PDZ domain-containing protein [Saprospiraceae bacterium]|nr:PDZ domain-containing protein [Saprospiraceae bacterium]